MSDGRRDVSSDAEGGAMHGVGGAMHGVGGAMHGEGGAMHGVGGASRGAGRSASIGSTIGPTGDARAPSPRHADLLEALGRAAGHPSGLTFVDLRETERFHAWSEIHARALHAGLALRAAGIARGDRVALILPTSPGFVVAFFGILAAGAVPVPLYPPVRLGRLEEYVAATTAMLCAVRARLLLTDAGTRLLLGRVGEQARPALGVRTLAEVVGDHGGAGGQRPATAPAARPVDPGSTALIQFSSGTTTAPRPVALSHAALMAECATLRELVDRGEEPPRAGVSWLPLYHDMGLIGGLLVAVTFPGHLVLIRPEHFLARPALWLRAISRHRAAISAAPSFAFALAARRIDDRDLEDVDLSCWRMAPCGGEPVAPAALDRFARRFAAHGFDRRALMPVYGLAEATLAVTFSAHDRPYRTVRVDVGSMEIGSRAAPGASGATRAIVSVGSPVPGIDLEIRDERGVALSGGRVGRIFVRGPTLMSGYFDQPDATARVLRDGWLETGDLGFIDRGELFICGREKDVIILRGANHVPEQFEECADGIAGLRAGCIVAVGHVPRGGDGEVLVVLAERPRSGTPPGPDDAEVEEALRRSIIERTGVNPHTIRLLPPGTLPRTSSGKLRRREAWRRFVAGELTPPAAHEAVAVAAAAGRSALSYLRWRLDR